MSRWKRHWPLLIVLILIYSWYYFTHLPTKQPSVNILGANANIQLFTQPDTGRQPLLDAINSAQKEIMVEVYILSDKQIIDALVQAHQRGVQVYVMLEQHPFGGGNLNNASEKKLAAEGIKFEWTNPAFALTHEKSMVIDGSKAFILSQNLSASSFTKNREYDVIDTDTADVTEVRDIFMADWQRQNFEPPSTHLIVSPKNSRSGITSLINAAVKSIDIEIEDINDSSIVAALSDIAKTRQVRIITPPLNDVQSNSEALHELVSAGVQVRTISSPYIHAKLILVDDSKAYIGSVNLSSQSMDENRELGIILSQQDSIQTLSSTFNFDWNKAVPLR